VAIVLMLMGGGLVLGAVVMASGRECRQARDQHRPDAEQICSRSSVVGHGGYVRTAASVVRGGFGDAGAAIGHALAG
jgi:hypothetical protein